MQAPAPGGSFSAGLARMLKQGDVLLAVAMAVIRGVMIVLAYLWPLALVPLVIERDDSEVRWHARHGILLMAVEGAVGAAYLGLSSLVQFARFGVGGLTLILIVLGWSAVLALHIAAILKGLNGRRLRVPAVSAFVR